jgi:hypothetical protein
VTVACINLRARFGSEYRIAFDPSYDPKGVPKSSLDSWMMTIPCRFGTIFPHGGDLLAAECDRHPSAWRKLDALPGVTLHQAGDGERTYLFDVSLWDVVADIIKPKRRRRLSAAHKQALLAANAATRFRPGSNDAPGERQALAPA